MTVLKATTNLQRSGNRNISLGDAASWTGDKIERAHLNQLFDNGFPIGTYFNLAYFTETWLCLVAPTGEHLVAPQAEMAAGTLIEPEPEPDDTNPDWLEGDFGFDEESPGSRTVDRYTLTQEQLGCPDSLAVGDIIAVGVRQLRIADWEDRITLVILDDGERVKDELLAWSRGPLNVSNETVHLAIGYPVLDPLDPSSLPYYGLAQPSQA